MNCWKASGIESLGGASLMNWRSLSVREGARAMEALERAGPVECESWVSLFLNRPAVLKRFLEV